MRRWACVVLLLAGFVRQDYVYAARPRVPVPIELPFDAPAGGALEIRLRPTVAWWLRR